MNKQEIEKALRFFRGLMEGGRCYDDKCETCDAQETAIDVLEHQLTNGWIPTTKPPNEYGTYMVAWRPINMTEGDVKTRTRSKITHFYEILEYDPEDESGWIETIKQSEGAYEILAWQPLPEPYKEDNDAERN